MLAEKVIASRQNPPGVQLSNPGFPLETDPSIKLCHLGMLPDVALIVWDRVVLTCKFFLGALDMKHDRS